MRALGHSVLDYTTLDTIDQQLRPFGHSLIADGRVRVATLVEKISESQKAQDAFHKASGTSGVADPSAARKRMVAAEQIFDAPEARLLNDQIKRIPSDIGKLEIVLKGGSHVHLAALYSGKAAYPSDPGSQIAAAARQISVPYFTNAVTVDEEGNRLQRTKHAAFTGISEKTAQNLMRFKFEEVDWLSIIKAYIKLTAPNANRFDFKPVTSVFDIPDATIRVLPIVKNLLRAVGINMRSFGVFVSTVTIVCTNSHPGAELNRTLNFMFNAYMRELGITLRHWLELDPLDSSSEQPTGPMEESLYYNQAVAFLRTGDDKVLRQYQDDQEDTTSSRLAHGAQANAAATTSPGSNGPTGGTAPVSTAEKGPRREGDMQDHLQKLTTGTVAADTAAVAVFSPSPTDSSRKERPR